MTQDKPADTTAHEQKNQELENQESVQELSIDDLFDVLSRPGNRFVLTYLLQEGGPVSVVDLVEYVVETTERPAGLQRAEFSGRLLGRFLGTTVPALEERGLISYDRSSGTIDETEATTLALPHLQTTLQQAALQQAATSSERSTYPE